MENIILLLYWGNRIIIIIDTTYYRLDELAWGEGVGLCLIINSNFKVVAATSQAG